MPITWSPAFDTLSVSASAGAVCSVDASTLNCTVSAVSASAAITAAYGGGARARSAGVSSFQQTHQPCHLPLAHALRSGRGPIVRLGGGAASPALAADNCTTAATTVQLPITIDADVTVTSITAASDDVCPGANGTVSFTVATSADAASLKGTLVSAAAPNAPVDASCTASGSGKAWTVTCTGAPPGTYALTVTATSALGEARRRRWARIPCSPVPPRRQAPMQGHG